MKKHNIFGIYLAAGNSTRFGGDKLKQDIQGKPLGSLALRTALDSDLQKVIAVTKHSNPTWFTPFLQHEKCEQLLCPEAHLGQAMSIHYGLRYAEQCQADAIIIMLADQPFITKRIIQTLIKSYIERDNIPFIAARNNHIVCPPILFSHRMFQDLYKLKGDHGAKHLLIKKAADGMFLNFTNKKAFYDVDTLTDYHKITMGE